MFRLILSAMIVGMLSAGPAWALFETNKELVASAKIPLDEAVKSALKVVPGKAAEAVPRRAGTFGWLDGVAGPMMRTNCVTCAILSTVKA